MTSPEYTQCLAYLKQGAALVVAVFLSWFGVHKDGEWLKEKNTYGSTPLHLALAYEAPEAVVMVLFAAWPDAAKEKKKNGYTPLHLALKKGVPQAVAMALVAAWPDAAKGKTNRGDTPLHFALVYKASEAVAVAVVAAWPDAVKEKGTNGNTPLHFVLEKNSSVESIAGRRVLVEEYNTPEAVVMAMIAACPDAARGTNSDGETPLHAALVALAYKKWSEAVVMALFAAWPDAVKEKKKNDSETPLYLALRNKAPEAVVMAMIAAFPDAAKGKSSDGDTLLDYALVYQAPEAVVMALFAACPNAVKRKSRGGYYPLHYAAEYHASDAVVRALIAAFPGALQEVTTIYPHRDLTKQPTGGYTVLHMLATAECSSAAETRNTNIICFTLVEKRASLTATNALGQTPSEASRIDKVANDFGRMVDRKPNPHLVASFREITAYKKLAHLSVMHFRDWTTVSHAWCTPSAKLIALTVLLVGETYKRGLLPRLPMDCWYRILNCIPRHELRQGGCELAEEQVARTKYLAILREAKARVDAAAAAAAAAAADGE